MSKIIQLPEHLANMIAAGEVVERPASVVKELVENSIDAEASTIKIDLMDYGLMKITVLDNGNGMSKDEIPLSLLRHATSKIASVDDLFHIASLGFRGEALPSIASVSTLTITSNTGDSEGYFYSFKAGKLMDKGSIPMTKGTKVEVEKLFFNTPARFQHLGTQYYELNAIIDYLHKSALAHPQISFSLQNNNKTIFQTSGNGNIPEIFSETYGTESAKALRPFKGENRLYRISGFTTNHYTFRSNRNGITIIVNGRVIRNLNLTYAITDAYQTLIPTGKYPLTILMIEVDPTLIDVNVHPSKMEVRFTDEKELRELIRSTIHQALLDENKDNSNLRLRTETVETVEEQEKKIDNIPSINSLEEENLWELFGSEEETQEEEIEEKVTNNETSTTEWKGEQLQFDSHSKRNFFQNLHYLGQFHQTYLLLEDNDNLYIIDQHAAMERIMYEKISKQFSNPNHYSYDLLIPVTIEFSIGEIPLILKLKDELKEMGILIESFGKSTIIVRSLPEWIPESFEIEFVSDIINHLLKGQKTGKERLYDSLAKSLSCKKSIKAAMTILEDEVTSLLHDLDQCEMPYTCPHGRPTIITFTNYELEKLFQRVL